jgi:hypothetical protein
MHMISLFYHPFEEVPVDRSISIVSAASIAATDVLHSAAYLPQA